MSDWEDEEHQRQISVATSLVAVEFDEHKINVLDTPGYSDFQGEVKNAVRVADAIVVVVDAVSGVEVGTELVWEYARAYQQPIMVVINKLDRENASYERTVEQLRTVFTRYRFVPVTLPIGQEAGLSGVYNALTQKAYYEAGRDRSELPDELTEAAQAAHMELTEAAAEADDVLLQKYFDEETLTPEEIRAGMRRASRSHLLNTVPVFAVSASANIGIFPLLEAFIAYVPSPLNRRIRIMRNGADEHDYIRPPHSNDDNLAAYVFRTSNNRYVGTMNFIRVFRGRLSSDSRNMNLTRGEEERFGTLMVMQGREQHNVATLPAGDIGVVVKLSHTRTGDTLGDRDVDFSIVTPGFAAPLYSVAVTPRTQADSAKMGGILNALCEADPTLRTRQDADTREIILEGMGEFHIAVAISRAETLGGGYRHASATGAIPGNRHRPGTGQLSPQEADRRFGASSVRCHCG